jgi:hypothetical protein
LASLRRERDDLKKQNQQQTETITELNRHAFLSSSERVALSSAFDFRYLPNSANRTLQAERQELLTYRTRHDKAVGAASSSLQVIIPTGRRVARKAAFSPRWARRVGRSCPVSKTGDRRLHIPSGGSSSTLGKTASPAQRTRVSGAEPDAEQVASGCFHVTRGGAIDAGSGCGSPAGCGVRSARPLRRAGRRPCRPRGVTAGSSGWR